VNPVNSPVILATCRDQNGRPHHSSCIPNEFELRDVYSSSNLWSELCRG